MVIIEYKVLTFNFSWYTGVIIKTQLGDNKERNTYLCLRLISKRV